ncbi:MAG: hypothetical protein ACI8ZO_001527 [Flavobacteriales bacterium]|jgi:hypothetical protein
MLKRISLLILVLGISFSSIAAEGIQKLKVQSTENSYTVTSTFRDTNLVIASPRIIETYTDYLIWESIQWGLVRLYAKLGDYFPNTQYAGFDTVNVEHLLTHTSGYPEARSISDVEALLFKPSEKYLPSNLNAELLKKVIAVRHGEGFYVVFPKWMQKIGLDNTEFITKDRTLSTTKKDLANWLNLWSTKSLLKPDVLNYFFSPQVQSESKKYSYAWELLGEDRLLAFDPKSPKEFMAIDAKNQWAIYVKSDTDFTHEDCVRIFNAENASKTKNNYLPILFVSAILLVLLIFLKRRKKAVSA